MKTNTHDNKNMRSRICKTCNCTFLGGPRAWYCPDCRAERARESGRKSHERARQGKSRKIGSIDICQNCRGKYVVMGSLQKYCKACSPEVIGEIDRIQGNEWYKKNKQDINPKRNEKRRKKDCECVICGKVFECDGTRRNTCSEECKKIQIKNWQRIGDANRGRGKGINIKENPV